MPVAAEVIRYARARVASIYERGNRLCIVSPEGAVWETKGPSAELLRAILEFLLEPRSVEMIRAHIAQLSGTDAEQSSALTDALDALKRTRAIVREGEEAQSQQIIEAGQLGGKNLLLALTGGVVAAHAPLLTELLQRQGFTVRHAVTRNALRFVRARALSALTHQPVCSSLWESVHDQPAAHLELANWADIVVIYPTTATTLSRLARGDCSSIVAAVALASRAVVVVVPAMNEAMLSSPAIKRNIAQLRSDGFVVVQPCVGYEVARPPGQRQGHFGAAPPLATLAAMVKTIAQTERPERPPR